VPLTPLAFVLVQTKSFIVVSFGNKQLFEVRKAVEFAAVQGVRLHPVQDKQSVTFPVHTHTHRINKSTVLYENVQYQECDIEIHPVFFKISV